MGNYIVTGVAGFIGARVCAQLLSHGHTVFGVDCLTSHYDIRLKRYRLRELLQSQDRYLCGDKSIYQHGVSDKATRFFFYQLDVEDSAGLDRIFATSYMDGVFHLAARGGVRGSILEPLAYLKTNTIGTLNVLESMRKHSVKKLVFASTSAVYAGCQLPFSEECALGAPLSPYAASKQAAELIAHTYHKLHGLDVTVLRYFTVYGPAGRPDMAPYRFIKWVQDGDVLHVNGDGKQRRDFTFVDDVARGTVAALATTGYQVINLGSGRPVDLLTLVAAIEGAMGKRARINFGLSHPADMEETWADNRKAKALLQWQPTIELSEGIRRAVEWFATSPARDYDLT